ncbi:MAG: tetratricopeptide repeat protein [Bacteroidota bacterium]
MKKIILFSIFILFCLFAKGQISKVDSLEKVLKTSPRDTNLVRTFNIIAGVVQFNNPEKGLAYCNKGLKLAGELNYEKGKAMLNNTSGICYSILGNYEEAYKCFTRALEGYTALNDKRSISLCLNNLGIYYYNQGDYSKALDYYLQSLKVDEALNDDEGMLSSYNNIGLIYKEQGNNTRALQYFSQALVVAEKLKDKAGLSMTYNNMGLVFWQQKKFAAALANFFKVLEIDKALDNQVGIAQSYNNIGLIYYEQKNFPLSLEYHLKAVGLFLSLNDNEGLTLAYSNMASIYEKTGDLKKSEEYAKLSLDISTAIGRKEVQRNSYQTLAQVYALQKNFKDAYKYQLLLTDIKDSLSNNESNKQIAEMSAKYETEKKEEQIKLLEKDKKIQKTVRNSFIFAFALMLLLAGVSYQSFLNKRKANTQLAIKNELIEEKQKEILDSINYAKRIQTAILPPNRIVKEHLPDSFILYKPKDIVAGDFYWLEHKNDQVLFAAADCTGHGVPGAMVSVICNNGLNRTVREYNITDPGKILDKTREIVIAEFEKSDEEVKDGMDISLCAFNHITHQILWAGANNPLWVIRDNEVIELRPDKQPIGKYAEAKPFATHSMQLKKGDSFYIFTDGYVDQFGGEKGKKFKSSKLKELLLSISNQPMNEQHRILDETFGTWKGNLEQVDDVCIIGVRV